MATDRNQRRCASDWTMNSCLRSTRRWLLVVTLLQGIYVVRCTLHVVVVSAVCNKPLKISGETPPAPKGSARYLGSDDGFLAIFGITSVIISVYINWTNRVE